MIPSTSLDAMVFSEHLLQLIFVRRFELIWDKVPSFIERTPKAVHILATRFPIRASCPAATVQMKSAHQCKPRECTRTFCQLLCSRDSISNRRR